MKQASGCEESYTYWFRSAQRHWPAVSFEGVGFGVERTPGDTSRNAPCFREEGQDGCLASSSEWGLTKTNDLTRSKGWDQGWRIPRPSQFPTGEINEGREQPFLCIIYSLRPLDPVAVVCGPPVGLLRPQDTEGGHHILTEGCNGSVLFATQTGA